MDHIDLFFGNEANESWHLFFSSNGNLPLIVENVGRTDESSKYCMQRDENSSLFVIEYVLKGEGTLEIYDKKYAIKQNDIYIIPPFQKHKYYSSSKSPLKKVWINFYSKMFKEILDNLNLADKVVFEDVGNLGKVFFDEVFAISEKSNYSDDVCYDLCPLIFNLFCSLSEYQENMKITHVSINAQKIKHVLDESINSNVSLAEVSEKLNYSKKQVVREFTKYYKITPHQYLIEEKMKASKTYLKATELTIKEISFRLGFESQHYFSNCFKKKYGCSPAEFRNKK